MMGFCLVANVRKLVHSFLCVTFALAFCSTTLAQPGMPGGPVGAGATNLTKKTIEDADVSILFIGNSHAAPIPSLLNPIFKANMPKKKFCITAAPGYGFLANHAQAQSTLNLLKKGKWDYVVLQAQKYSTSGKYKYPIDGALKLSEIAKKQNTKVIMYPEWSRRSAPQEYKRIHKLHQTIAKKTGASVAPVGYAWVAAAKKDSKIRLLSGDGNHATQLGSYLNACLFYSMVTGKPIKKTPVFKSGTLPKKKLQTLQDESWKVLKDHKLVEDQ